MKTNYQRGYTILELLTVLTIASILSSVAIPKYRDYTKRAYDERARSDLMGLVVAQEAYFLENESYLSCESAECAALPGFRAPSPCVVLVANATSTGFSATARCEKGTREFSWNSESGIIQ